MAFQLDDPLVDGSDEWPELFKTEVYHIVKLDAGDLHSRRHIVPLILQVQCECNINAFVVYLAVNYVDRFLSCSRGKVIKMDSLQLDKKPWIFPLLAISALLLASKMKKSNIGLRDLQRTEGFNFPATAVKRMELLVLQSLEWRMRSVTPFSFLRFFLPLFATSRCSHSIDALKSRASCVLLNCQSDEKTMGYRPSVVAASALVIAAEELFPADSVAFCAAISSSGSVQKETLSECSAAIRESPAIDACQLKAGTCFCAAPSSDD